MVPIKYSCVDCHLLFYLLVKKPAIGFFHRTVCHCTLRAVDSGFQARKNVTDKEEVGSKPGSEEPVSVLNSF